MPPTAKRSKLPPELEPERVLPLDVAAELTSLSEDTLKRRYSKWILDLSPRRLGMRLKHALSIGETT
jgi:hypothetical protein